MVTFAQIFSLNNLTWFLIGAVGTTIVIWIIEDIIKRRTYKNE